MSIIWGFINKSVTYFTVESSINIIFSNDAKCITREGYYVEKNLCKVSNDFYVCMYFYLYIYKYYLYNKNNFMGKKYDKVENVFVWSSRTSFD